MAEVPDSVLLCYENFSIDGPIYPETKNLTIEARLEALNHFSREELEEEHQLPPRYVNAPVLSSLNREKAILHLIMATNNLLIHDEPLFLAVNVMDCYFCSKSSFDAVKLQHLTVGFLYHGVRLALSYGQIQDSPVKESFCNQGNPKLTEAEFDSICDEIGKEVGNRTYRTTSLAAMRYMVLHDHYATFLLKLTLTQHQFLRFLPSLVATVAVHISCLLHPCKTARVKAQVTRSGYPPKQLRMCFDLMFTLVVEGRKGALLKITHPYLMRDLQENIKQRSHYDQ